MPGPSSRESMHNGVTHHCVPNFMPLVLYLMKIAHIHVFSYCSSGSGITPSGLDVHLVLLSVRKKKTWYIVATQLLLVF